PRATPASRGKPTRHSPWRCSHLAPRREPTCGQKQVPAGASLRPSPRTRSPGAPRHVARGRSTGSARAPTERPHRCPGWQAKTAGTSHSMKPCYPHWSDSRSSCESMERASTLHLHGAAVRPDEDEEHGRGSLALVAPGVARAVLHDHVVGRKPLLFAVVQFE